MKKRRLKYYGEIQNKKQEEFKYRAFKLQEYLYRFSTLNKEKRELKKEKYEHMFSGKHKYKDKDTYSIPENRYYKPVGIFTTDLVEKNKINEIKKGLKELILKNTSHKFMGSFSSLDDIINSIDSIEDTFSWYHTEIRCGRFDFINSNKLNEIIDYFDITIRNFNTSYLSIEVEIYIAKNMNNKINDIINNDYAHDRGFTRDIFTNSNKKNGGKKSKSIIYYNNAHLKSEILNEKMIEIKWVLFNEIQKFLPLVLHNKNIMPPSVNIYDTNILEDEENSQAFLSSVGISQFNGQYINEKEKLYFYTEISDRDRLKKRQTDMIFLVNKNLYDNWDGFYSFNFRTMMYFQETYKDIYKSMIATTLFDRFATICIKYKKQLNNIQPRIYSLNKILKLRYNFESEITWYKNFANETDWYKEAKKVENIFDKEYETKGYNYTYLINTPLHGHERLNKFIKSIQQEIDRKLVAIGHLDEYKKSKMNTRINLIMLFISLVTLVLVIFPNFANELAYTIINILSTIKNKFLK